MSLLHISVSAMDLNATLARRRLLTNMRLLNGRMMAFINEIYEGDANPQIINHVEAFLRFVKGR